MEEIWTIQRVLQWTTGYFSQKGIEQPRANAEVLLAHVLGTERIQLYLHYDKPLSAHELASYRGFVQRRVVFEPTQYITGKQEFWSLDFEVTPAVLIPRPETELLVEKALEILRADPALVLDLGTGSGAVAVALAYERSSVQVVATDKSTEALIQAQRNAARHGVRNRIRFAAMDLFSGFSCTLPPFDIIISNPPYISEGEFRSLAAEVAKYEPEAALRGGGPQGLSVIRQILSGFAGYLKPEGSLLMEIGKGQAEILRDELAENMYVERFEFISDYAGIPRVLHLRKTCR
ncbi:MAG: peptide chain release factor N(5)-glutamine methyltransferase [Syntrophobacteraceae bacterium]